MPNLFNPSYLKSLCVKYSFTPSKHRGQNFLVNPKPIEKMIEAADLSRKDTVVEVGPGFGVLTFALADCVGRVVTFEIEEKLKDYWGDLLNSDKQYAISDTRYNNIEIIWKDIMNKRYEIRDKRYKVIANLPYQITSGVIRKFLEAEHKPEIMVLMAQKEVAERICAKPGDMSVLSIAVQYYAEPKIIMNVPKTYFWPVPKVDSAVLKMSLRGGGTTTRNDRQFFQLVKAGFASRRKLLINNLMVLFGKDKKQEILNAFEKVGLTKNARAQELGVGEWVALRDCLELR